MCVEFEAAKYVPTNWMTDCKNKNWKISFINQQWLFKWKISYNLRAETNLNRRLLRNSVNTSLSLTNAISFIITVTKMVASGHELWQLANRKILSWVKKLVNAMMRKGVSLLLPERSLKTLEGKKHLLQQRKKKVNYQVGRVSLSVWAFCFSNKSSKILPLSTVLPIIWEKPYLSSEIWYKGLCVFNPWNGENKTCDS